MSAKDYYNAGPQQGYGQPQYGGAPPQGGYYPPPQGPPQGYYPPQPEQAYQQPGRTYLSNHAPLVLGAVLMPVLLPHSEYYQPQPQPQTIYVQQQEQKGSGAGGGTCMACLAGCCLCCCAEEICDCLL
ncbi:hypothetical protein EXIGLDRAFT_833626 [Exidia glandulosa HHB12029]|uniref:Uncharacterized protein n=1 Tax=Exidia glandulosa HHB12029 TaxID=1314781 RepID=A0A165KIE8_EXIGL|nr:hypothetical protein EXIGLDRAFT_833626 [Exidia glandulosa HHB12029]